MFVSFRTFIDMINLFSIWMHRIQNHHRFVFFKNNFIFPVNMCKLTYGENCIVTITIIKQSISLRWQIKYPSGLIIRTTQFRVSDCPVSLHLDGAIGNRSISSPVSYREVTSGRSTYKIEHKLRLPFPRRLRTLVIPN